MKKRIKYYLIYEGVDLSFIDIMLFSDERNNFNSLSKFSKGRLQTLLIVLQEQNNLFKISFRLL